MSANEVTVPGWPAPKGYANGRFGAGRVVHVGGQIGWNADGIFPDAGGDAGFVAQFAQTLDNVVAVVKAAGGAVEDIAEMTAFVTDMPAYRRSRKELAGVWRERLGKHFPAMALLGVKELFEEKAVVEIAAIAYVGDGT
ncbi:MAG TPA: RidA family protein [Kofleriaceae bacterium]|jgi:enamine deaminase RidA (YjgF/YER057c/UK114 family)